MDFNGSRKVPKLYIGAELSENVLILLPRDAMLARHMLSPCVCLSLRLSHAGIVSKRLNVGSRKQLLTIEHGL